MVLEVDPRPGLGPADLHSYILPSPLTGYDPLQDTPSEDILGELGLVVILVCYDDGDVHGLFH